jgi:hypothetical protein
MSLFLLGGVSGCASPGPLIPTEIHQEIQADGREWTYDVAWQNTRMLAYSVENELLDDLTDQALILTARLHRLDTGRAGAMADRKTARALTQLEQRVQERSVRENTTRLSVITPQLQEFFDEGDFAGAKRLALEVLVISRLLDDLR